MSQSPLPAGVITFLYTDIQGSTPLWEQHPQAMHIALNRHNDIMHKAVADNGGQVYKIIGDEFQSVFVEPLQALRAALAAQRALAAADWGAVGAIKVRMGLHLGHSTPEPDGGDYITTHTQNRVARIMSAGHGGQILLSVEVAGLVRSILPAGVGLLDLGEHRLKGMQAPEHLFQVTAADLEASFPPLRTLGTAARLAGRYEQQAIVGRGGMGTVYRGWDIEFDRPVAIKALHPDIIGKNPDLITRFIREGEVLRQLNHPNIVQMIDAFEQDGHHYLVMEYIEGGDLAARIAAGLSVDEAVAIALELADALTRAHHLNVIHRDIKPANVLIPADGAPRLTDFGVAHRGDLEMMTGSGMMVGTLAYMAPENVLGEPATRQSDLWSFGVLLYEMLVGQRPFTAVNLPLLMHKIMAEPIPDPLNVNPDLPDALLDILYRLLDKDPHSRLPSARLLGAELEGLLSGTPLPGSHRVERVAHGERVAQSERAAQSERFSPLATASTASPLKRKRHNLPAQVTEFVGRTEELDQLRELLTRSGQRLVTILGPGGMGKSRLSLEVGQRLLAAFADGVFFVELAKLDDAANIPGAIGDAADYSFSNEGTPQEQILQFLGNKQMLLILDNFEHLQADCRIVTDILRAAPGVTILATSRTRLNLSGETAFVLDPLDYPDWETPADALRYTAVQLFMQSAKRVLFDFELQQEDLAYLTRIVRLVGGVPLGILLAAAWVDTLSLAEIAAEIEESLDILETEMTDLPERQRSMRAAIDYSWKLLAEEERLAFARLSVFQGGCTRQAAQAVGGVSIRMLTTLVNKSLLRRDQASKRFEMHALLQQFAVEHLQASGQAAAIQDKHANYYLATLAERNADLKGGNQVGAVADIQSDFENIRTAWQRAVAVGLHDHMRPAVESLGIYAGIHSRQPEAVAMLERLKEKIEGQHTPLAVVVLAEQALLAYFMNSAILLEQAQTALTIAEELGDVALLALANLAVGNMLAYANRRAEGVALLKESLRQYEAVADRYQQAFALECIGYAHRSRLDGELEWVQAVNQRCLQIRREIGDIWGQASIMNNLGDDQEAAYELRKQLGDKKGMAWSGVTVGWHAVLAGDFDKARRFIDEARFLIDEINDPQATFFILSVYMLQLGAEGRHAEIAPILDRVARQPVSRSDMLVGLHAYRTFQAVWAGDDEAAAQHAKAIHQIGHPARSSYLYAGVPASLLLEQRGHPALALTIYHAGLRGESSWSVMVLVQEMLARIRETLSEAEYEAAVARGETIEWEEVRAILEEHGLA